MHILTTTISDVVKRTWGTQGGKIDSYPTHDVDNRLIEVRMEKITDR